MKKAASFISLVFHPIFAPLWAAVALFQQPLYFNFSYPQSYYWAIYACLFFNLVLIPLSMIHYLKKQGMISSYRMEQVEERIYPYGIILLFYALSSWLFWSINLPIYYLAVFLCSTLAIVFLLLFALLKVKVSAHLAGIGGILGMLITVNQIYGMDTLILLSIGLLLAGIIASARLLLKAHNVSEVLLGFCLGLGTQLLLLLL